MRPSKSRSRAKNNRRPAGNNINRVFDSSGPEGKVRGTPQQIIEKYLGLARDATLSNDRVAAENFHQHAEHYTRLLAEAQREIDARREQHEGQQQRRERGGEGEGDDGSRDEPRHGQGGKGSQPRDERGHDPQGSRSDRDGSGRGNTGDDVFEGGGDPGLVETPEAAPKQRRASPRRRSGGSGAAGSETGSGDATGGADGSSSTSADAAE